jgi:hypothetical protein
MVLKSFATIFWALLFLAVLPTVSALPNEGVIPDVTFREFNILVQENFGTDVTLATVLMVLFTLTNNPTLLSLHARQQNLAVQGENRVGMTAWMKALACALHKKLAAQVYALEMDGERDTKGSNSVLINSLEEKLTYLQNI